MRTYNKVCTAQAEAGDTVTHDIYCTLCPHQKMTVKCDHHTPLVAVRPEPAVDVDRLKRGGVAALVQEVALAAAGPHGRDVV